MYVIEKGNEPNMDIVYRAFADMLISIAMDSDSPQEYMSAIIEGLKEEIERDKLKNNT